MIERHIERARLGLFIHPECNRDQDEGAVEVSKLCSGLPALCSIILKSYQLPHPGIHRLAFDGQVRASEISKKVYKLLERGLVQIMFNDKRYHLSDVLGLSVIRITGKGPPQLVRLSYEKNQDTVQVFAVSSNQKILDGPTDSPQYIAVFGLGSELEQIRRSDLKKRRRSQTVPPLSSFLFQNVFIEDHLKGDSNNSLSTALAKLSSRYAPIEFL